MLNCRFFSAAALALLALAPLTSAEVHHPDWAKNATIYEVNIRQYSPEGRFAGVDRQLPRLKAMGIDILWLMPINPIGRDHRKGPLGSYYAVAEYKAVNPEFGTLDDFKALVAHAHALGMKVIIDWVPNHTAWDNPWVKAHPDWYLKDASGKIGAVTFGTGADAQVWDDVVGLDYRVPALRAAMIEAMAFWLRETGIDGFRCDVASNVPTDFWNEARVGLDAIKPVFLLAEADKPQLHQDAFDMTYEWDFYHLMVKVAKGEGDGRDLAAYFNHPPKVFPAGSYRMTFTSDHDENSWSGSDPELYGKGFKVYAVLAATVPGMALVYSGQESGLDKRLKFFERDPIAWKDFGLSDFYRALLSLKHNTPALWNGADGGSMEIIDTANPKIFAFRRMKDGHGLRVIVNLSGDAQKLEAPGLKPQTLEGFGYQITPQ